MPHDAKTPSNLEELGAMVAARKKIPARLKELDKEYSERQQELLRLENMLRKEEADVNKLLRQSVTSMFYRLLKSKERQLDIELQEYVVAALKYNECLDALQLIEYEVDILESRLIELPGLERQFESMLIAKETLLRKEHPELAGKLLELDSRSYQCGKTINEINEALKTGMRARSQLQGLLKELAKVKRWGRWPNNDPSQGLAGKRSFIDRARKKAVKTHNQLETFERELHDVFKELRITDAFNLDTFEYFLNIFYDSLITDWVVRRNLSNTTNNVEGAIDRVNRILASLRSEKRDLKKHINEIDKQKQTLIITHS